MADSPNTRKVTRREFLQLAEALERVWEVYLRFH